MKHKSFLRNLWHVIVVKCLKPISLLCFSVMYISCVVCLFVEFVHLCYMWHVLRLHTWSINSFTLYPWISRNAINISVILAWKSTLIFRLRLLTYFSWLFGILYLRIFLYIRNWRKQVPLELSRFFSRDISSWTLCTQRSAVSSTERRCGLDGNPRWGSSYVYAYVCTLLAYIYSCGAFMYVNLPSMCSVWYVQYLMVHR